jgi:hypothetical protein
MCMLGQRRNCWIDENVHCQPYMLSIEFDPVRCNVGELFGRGNITNFFRQRRRVYETEHGELFSPVLVIVNLNVMVTSPIGMSSKD